MTFERTRDWDYIRRVAQHEKLWPHLSDDFSGEREEWRPNESEHLVYVKVVDGDEPLGFFLLVPHSPVLWDIHTALLPSAWGARARAAAEGIVAWLWENTEAARLITAVPTQNRLALRFAQRAGMTEYGRNPRCYRKRGQLEDLILLGLSRPDEKLKKGTY
jgi:RimJ/RimL family protein N-acetyltransferase